MVYKEVDTIYEVYTKEGKLNIVDTNNEVYKIVNQKAFEILNFI